MTKSKAALVIGAHGAIGSAMVAEFAGCDRYDQVVAVSRRGAPEGLADKVRWCQSDYSDASIEQVCQQLTQMGDDFRRVAICTGTLHDEHYQPEKQLSSIDPEAMMAVYQINAVVPTLCLKYLLPVLKNSHCRIAVLSARVGSISDNRLGGWYSYRASKAALNMLLKTLAIEYARRARGVKLIAFHPGTTDSPLSKPFHASVPDGKLFTPQFVAARLARLLDNIEADRQLSYLDWQGKTIDW